MLLILRHLKRCGQYSDIIGLKFKNEQIICFVQTYYGLEPVIAHKDGKLIQIEMKQGDEVVKNQILAYLE